eukprot:TRINITY_DN2208_c6_g1_i1.p1 TRINITY_DN2208_c6_g1~~TRINITY_DN2208_c6_g1_i1.p1  ORF type:complete len:400 (+),score=164.65 TRINITY_DN2208_c6_g1_i1:139-1200(+)
MKKKIVDDNEKELKNEKMKNKKVKKKKKKTIVDHGEEEKGVEEEKEEKENEGLSLSEILKQKKNKKVINKNDAPSEALLSLFSSNSKKDNEEDGNKVEFEKKREEIKNILQNSKSNLKKRKRGEFEKDNNDSDNVFPSKKKQKLDFEDHKQQMIEKLRNDTEKNKRTIFIGNVPVDTKKMEIKNYFKEFGTIESIRFRSLPVGTLALSKKACYITKNFHDSRESCNCYVVFSENQEALDAANKTNGTLFKERHIRVDVAINSNRKVKNSLSIFVGNLPFDVEDEELWSAFEQCGGIDNVRVVRENGMGKGFGFVTFKQRVSVDIALKRNNTVKIRDQTLRITKSVRQKKQQQQ